MDHILQNPFWSGCFIICEVGFAFVLFFLKPSLSIGKVTVFVQLLFGTCYKVLLKDVYFDIRACAWSPRHCRRERNGFGGCGHHALVGWSQLR